MTLLSVNINKIATLRNSRGHDQPNLLSVTKDIISFGAQGITIHPRPDERHIKRADVKDLSKLLKSYPHVEFNIEGFPSNEFIDMVISSGAHQCTLVPDPPEVITSNAGWKIKNNKALLTDVCEKLKINGIRSSLFIDPYQFNKDDLESLAAIDPDRIELYTERFAKNFESVESQNTVNVYKEVAVECNNLGIGINAGHDLNLNNLAFFLKNIPMLIEVSIGHAIVCDALYLGLETTIAKYLEICNGT